MSKRHTGVLLALCFPLFPSVSLRVPGDAAEIAEDERFGGWSKGWAGRRAANGRGGRRWLNWPVIATVCAAQRQ